MKIEFNIDPTHEFKNELLCIQNPFYLKIVVGALHKVPAYFWLVPASSSGKYHPKSSLGLSGLVRHVKSAFWISEEMLTHPLYAPFTDNEKDEIRIAILLHDACKQGVENDGSHTVVEHPLLVRLTLNPFEADGIVRTPEEEHRIAEAWDNICNLIETHMGIWTKDKQGNEVLDVPKTKAQLFVHQCDFLASRKIIEVDVTPREEQQGYGNKSDKEAWKSEPATDNQVGYIKKLYVIVGEKGLHYPPMRLTDGTGKVVLTKGLATDAINALKDLLGMK